jgi:CYTH domain-containing protein
MGGVSPLSEDIGTKIGQAAIIATAYSLEEIWVGSALASQTRKPILIIYDRGITDCAAYTTKPLYKKMLNEHDMLPAQVRDGRYDAVIHLRTAADGAEKFYTLSTNAARHETARQARKQDKKTLQAWIGHPHLRIIDNSTSFDKKLHRMYQEVCSVVGIPVPIERERKFLVWFDRSKIPRHTQQVVNIEQVYLVSPDPTVVVRMRKREQDKWSSFYLTKKQALCPGQNIETEQIIDSREYTFGLNLKDLSRALVKKTRTCVVHANQYFELDEFKDPRATPGAIGLLEIELTDINHEVIFPNWIRVNREVTDDPHYSNYEIARRLAVAQSS